MWKISKIESTNRNLRFGIEENGSPISNYRFLELLIDSPEFRTYYNKLLSECRYEAFFWENRPVNKQNINEPYECNLVKSSFLSKQAPDLQAFDEYLKSDQSIVTFPNLGRDAQLIVPCPKNTNNTYTHIGTFVRGADDEQIQQLWKIAGQQMLLEIGTAPKWLSTSGLGVFWLHIRIDLRPKYYQTEDYKLD